MAISRIVLLLLGLEGLLGWCWQRGLVIEPEVYALAHVATVAGVVWALILQRRPPVLQQLALRDSPSSPIRTKGDRLWTEQKAA